MTLSKKFLTVSIFLLFFAGMAGADALLTWNKTRFPQSADTGVVKKGEPEVSDVALELGYAEAETGEEFLLQKIVPEGTAFPRRVLLQQNDRLTAIAWIDSPDVKRTFTLLKERLTSSFSPLLRDLIDTTQADRGRPPRDLLSFRDPAIHTDRVLFVRVRQRLYEFHITTGKEPEIDRLVNALTK